MSRKSIHIALATTALAAGMFLGLGQDASASSVSGRYQEDSRCDVLPNQMLSHELGDVLLFPALDALAYHDHRAHFVVGVPDDGVANDWTVHITNVSGQAWRNLYFVADIGATIGNADGRIEDLSGAAGTLTDAFRIDAVGVNAPLYNESMDDDGILQPGEEWEFVVTNFGTGSNSMAPSLITPGVFSGSSPLGGPGGTNASILAVPVPEPTTVGALVLAGLAMLARRPRRRA